MSTAPEGYQTPKTDWKAADIPTKSDFNRAEGNAAAIETGERTLNQSLANPANAGTLRQILSWFAGRLKAITGEESWFTAPAATLKSLLAKFHGATGHKHTGEAGQGPKIPPTSISPQGAGSGLDADLVRGRNVIDDIENVAYDLYLLWLEQYYLGEVAGGPSPGGVKAIMFDGFLNYDNLQDYSTPFDAPMQYASLVISGPTLSRMILPMRDMLDECDYTIVKDTLSSGDNIQDNDRTTRSMLSNTTKERIYKFGEVKNIREIYFKASGDKNSNLAIRGGASNPPDIDLVSAHPEYAEDREAVKKVSGSYRYFSVYGYAPSDRYLYIYEVELRDEYFGTATATSKIKALLFDTKRITVYLSTECPAGTDVVLYASNDGGLTWVQAGEPIFSREDPKFATYTEYEYEIMFAETGNQLQLKFELSTSDGTVTPSIKRYGVHIFEA